MIEAQKACTLEADEVAVAVAEIIAQLNLDALKAHTIGLVSCLYDYIENGVVAALQEALPFDLIGQTSIATSTPDSDDLDQLSLLVLTSNEVAFKTSLSAAVDGTDTVPLADAYTQASIGHSEEPSLVLTYVPLLLTASGDFFVSATNSASRGASLFGSLAIDNTLDYRNSRVVYKGQGYRDRAAYVLFYGKMSPRFYLAGITHGRVFDKTGVVTKSTGSQLQTINDAPVAEFLASLGITANKEGEFVGINSFPYLVDYNDGTDPVIRVMFAVTPDGSAVCGGDIPVGATLAVSFFDSEEILTSSKASMDKLARDIASDGAQAVLCFSCIGRYFNLGYEPDAEAQLLHDALDAQGVPYSFTYSGGEICPVHIKNGSGEELANRAHNSTFVAVALQ